VTQFVDTDVVVVVPGIMGSTLGRPRPEGGMDRVWAPSLGVALNAIRTFGRSLGRLELPEGIGDSPAQDGVIPLGLMPDLHILPGIWSANIGYDHLVEWLKTRFGLKTERDLQPGQPAHDINLVLFAYDWRLSNRLNGRLLGQTVRPVWEQRRTRPGCQDAKVMFLCHSMGGLIARWYVDCEDGADLARKIVTLGTPHRGAVKALDQLVNGVRLKGGLPVGLLGLARSLPSLHQLLPAYACVEAGTGPLARLPRPVEHPSDGLAPSVEVPELSAGMLADGMAFFEQLDAGRASSAVPVRPLGGTRQPTATTARLSGNRIIPVGTIGGEQEWGDATVPRLSVAPLGVPASSDTIATVAEQHGSLQANPAIQSLIEGALTGSDVEHLGPDPERVCQVGLDVPEFTTSGDGVAVSVIASRAGIPVRVQLYDEDGQRVDGVTVTPHNADTAVEIMLGEGVELGAGMCRIGASGVSTPAAVSPVSAYTLVSPGDLDVEE
jgi:hypothetical protein